MLALRIALRYLFSPKSHTAVNVISLISLAGVGVAAMAMVCVLSVFNGFSDLALGRLSRLSPPVRVERADGGKVIAGADSLAARLEALPCVERALPTVEERALAVGPDVQMPVRLKGVAEGFDAITELDSVVIDGAALLGHDTGHDPMATLSVGTALGLDMRPGDWLALYTPRRLGRINPALPSTAFRGDTLMASGVFQTEQAEYDADMVIVPLAAARRLLDYHDGQATAIEVLPCAGAGISDIAAALPTGLRALDRAGQQATSLRMIAVEKWITFLLLAFIMLIASFNVVSTLTMLIIEKREGSATMLALGATPLTLRAIFAAEGWLVTLIGGASGTLAGILLCLAQQCFGFITLGGNHDAMSVTVYPVRVAPADALAVICAVALAGLLTSALALRRLNR